MKIESGLLGVEESLKALSKLVAAEERALIDAMEYILREMCNYAKKNGPWTDRTGNLRNGISVNMDTMKECTAGETPPSGGETPVIRVEGDEYVGCLSSAMEYSIWIETKSGYWVLTGAIDWMSPKIEELFAGKLAVSKLDLGEIATISYLKYQTNKQFGR